MRLFDLQDRMNRELPVWAVDMKTFSVKYPVEPPSDPNQRPKLPDPILKKGKDPICYTMPTVVKMYVIGLNELKNKADCRRPLDFRKPDMSDSYIDYHGQVIQRLHESPEAAEATITEELVRRFIQPEFIKKFPQIADRHPMLKDIFAKELEEAAAEKEAILDDEELIDEEVVE